MKKNKTVRFKNWWLFLWIQLRKGKMKESGIYFHCYKLQQQQKKKKKKKKW